MKSIVNFFPGFVRPRKVGVWSEFLILRPDFRRDPLQNPEQDAGDDHRQEDESQGDRPAEKDQRRSAAHGQGLAQAAPSDRVRPGQYLRQLR